ncbi:hypothetical protein LPJ72_003853 [Coemansia sp. Benny D160-2]|nr:hypothetical protein LPJ72_003853 [Coemansia sp. Benny D160-2]
MALLRTALLCLVGINGIVQLCSLPVSAHLFHERDGAPDVKSDLKTSKRGVLVKNNKVTSCELGLFSDLRSVLSADCLDYTSDNKLDTTTTYMVYVDDGIDGKADKYQVQRVTVHPDYNPTTKANNIATLNYNMGMNSTWHNVFGIGREKYWGKMVYTRSTITDLDAMKWNDPEYVFDPVTSEDSTCDSMSVLYSANKYDFTCIGNYTKSSNSDLTQCGTPFGTAYTYIDNTLYPVGFYSYSSAVGDAGDTGLCDVKSVRNYYSAISDWMVYIGKQTSINVLNYYPVGTGLTPINTPDYTLRDPGVTEDGKFKVVGGDYYKDQGLFTASVTSDTITAITTEFSEQSSGAESGMDDRATIDDSSVDTTATETDTNTKEDSESISSGDKLYISSNDINSKDESGGEGSNKKTIIIAVVCAVVGAGILFAILFLVYRRWRKRSSKQRVEEADIRAAIYDMEKVGTAGPDVNYFAGNGYSQTRLSPRSLPPHLNIDVNGRRHEHHSPVYDFEVPTPNRPPKKNFIDTE